MVDERFFVEQVQQMERTLYRVSRSILSNWEECADAVQEALMKAWQKHEQVQPDYFHAWLMRIVINECHNINRKKKRVLLVESIQDADNETPNDPELKLVLSELPEKWRLPLILYHLEGFSIAQTAQMLRLPSGTVKSRLHQARKQLRKELMEGFDEIYR